MWNKSRYPRSLLEAMALHSLLNLAGYSLKEEVFFGLNDDSVTVELRAEGLVGSFRMGAPELDLTTMKDRWVELIRTWNTGGTMTPAEKDDLYKSTLVSRMEPTVFAALADNGFKQWKVHLQKKES